MNSPDDDLSSAALPKLASVASGVFGFQALLTLLLGLQSLGFGRLPLAGMVAMVLLVALGVASFVVMLAYRKARPWAVFTSLILSGVGTLMVLAWIVFLMMGGVVSLLSWLALVVSLFAITLLAVELGTMQRVAAARKRLADEGLNL